MKENTTTLNEFKDTELPNGRLFFSDNLKLFNENEGKFQLSQLSGKYMFYEARTPKIAELEIEYIFIFIKNYWKFKQGSTEIEKGAQANKLTMKPAFSDSDGAVPTYSQRGTGIWQDGNIQRRFFEDIDHQEFYGGENLERTETAKFKARMILQNTYSDLELESRSRFCPWIEITRVPLGDSTLIEGQFYFPIFDIVNGGNGKPGLWISKIQIRKDSLNGDGFQNIRFEIEEDGKFTIKAKTSELPEENQFIVLVLKDESEVFTKIKDDDIKLVFNNDLKKWYRTIQAAVNEASEGHEILVYPGILRDPVNIDKTLTIRSTQGRDATIIDGVNFPNLTAFVMNNCSPIIDGFTIKNWRKGVAMGGINTYPEIKNNIIENNDWGGIQLLGGAAIKLYNNIIRNNDWHAIEINTPVQGEVNSIEENEIYNNFNGIIAARIAVLEIKTNNIYSNILGGDGIRLSGENISALITNNTIKNNERDGITVSDGASATILHNQILNNSGGGIFVYSNSNESIITDNMITGNRYGILARRATISNNTISNNQESGIYAESSTLIQNNIITGNSNWGITSSRFNEYISNVTITNNTINLNGGGVHIHNVDDVEIVQNNIYDNTFLRGLNIDGQRLNVSNNQIVNNNGGGIHSSGGIVNISNNNISGNIAEYGGGVYILNQGTSLSNNTISDNFATIKGGGVYGRADGWQRFETVIVNEMPREVKRHVPCFMENSNSYSGNSHGEVFGEWGPGSDNWCPEAGHDVTID
jgi:parallel beta-helix repeat protein